MKLFDQLKNDNRTPFILGAAVIAVIFIILVIVLGDAVIKKHGQHIAIAYVATIVCWLLYQCFSMSKK